ncbi:MAG: hypothetical protein MJZ28_09455 [Paludibacteraceae bacterium]|nr:hypothetical protein [Paludibacteraceae bacterium]
MYSEELEALIKSVVADGEYSAKEKRVLHKKAKELGIDIDELDVYVEGLSQIALNQLNAPKEEAQQTPQQQPLMNQNMDNIRKCPNCGAVVPAGVGKCTECGYAFVNVSANKSSLQLMQELKNATSPKEVILNFPIPSGKEDLIEFLITMDTKRRVGDNLSSIYNAKYNEAKLKAQILFPEDSSIRNTIVHTEAGWQKDRTKSFFKKPPVIMITISIFSLFLAQLADICHWYDMQIFFNFLSGGSLFCLPWYYIIKTPDNKQDK